jgi:hypothetical protein
MENLHFVERVMTLEVVTHMLLQCYLKVRQSIDTQLSDFHFWVMISHHGEVGWFTNISENLRDCPMKMKMQARQSAKII